MPKRPKKRAKAGRLRPLPKREEFADQAAEEEAAEERLRRRRDIGSTAKETLIGARRGQGLYRQRLEQIENRCRVTGLLDRRHLKARHIKPWRVCDDQEKLDGCNGLLFSPHIDHLFERGHITFSDTGELKVAKGLNLAVLERWGITMPRNVGAFRAEQCRYLAYHREHVFEKSGGGRRGKSAQELELIEIGEPAVIRPA